MKYLPVIMGALLVQATVDPAWAARQAAYSKWWSCVSRAAEEFARQPDPADVVVSAAFGICAPDLTLFGLAAAEERGGESEDAFAVRWQAIMRPGLLGMVMSYRVRARAGQR